jgi:SAM-dependent methyltransferase
MKFYLTDDIIKSLVNYFTLDSKNLELEIRILLNQNKFEKLENYLKELGLKPYILKSEVAIFSQNIRKIQTNDEIIFEKKYNIKNFDVSYKDFDIRLSLSKEEIVIDDVSNKKIIQKRIRDRTEYTSVNDTYKYVFTKVTTIKNYTEEVSNEFEIEYNLNYKIKDIVNNIRESIEKILPIFTKDSLISYIPKNFQNEILHIFHGTKIREIKPVNLKRYNIPVILSEEFSVTNKLDGERFFILFCKYGIFGINNTKTELLSDSSTYELCTVLDSELFNGVFHVFDCLMYENTLLQKSETHKDRIENIAKELCEAITEEKEIILKPKDFFTDIEKSTRILLDKLPRKDNDGLIYTSKYGDVVYKWKFPEKMTIDFEVKEVDPLKYQIYVGGYNDTLKRFLGNENFPLSEKESVYISQIPLKNYSIYEFSYKNEKFVLERLRCDKNRPNFFKTAEDVWNDIKNPFTEKELEKLLSEEILVNYRKHHNSIKRELISKYCKNKTVLDLGAGRGGDLGKYLDNDVKELFVVEPNMKNLCELSRRLCRSFDKLKDKIIIIEGVAQDTENLKNIVENPVDVICSFFSLSFFFFNEKDLDNLVNTINAFLKNNGVFIGTTIDGIKTFDLLKKNNETFEFEGGMYQTVKEGIKLTQKGTIVEEQIESLVDFTLFQRKLELKNIYLQESSFFEKNESLKENQNFVNDLYRTFVFKKDIKNNVEKCDEECINILEQYKKIIGSPSIDLQQLKKYSGNYKKSKNRELNLVHKIIFDL